MGVDILMVGPKPILILIFFLDAEVCNGHSLIDTQIRLDLPCFDHRADDLPSHIQISCPDTQIRFFGYTSLSIGCVVLFDETQFYLYLV